jgi:CRISPR/Cas system-associated endoribonuclease Cas2
MRYMVNSATNYSIIERIEKLIETETDPIKRILYRKECRALLEKLNQKKIS